VRVNPFNKGDQLDPALAYEPNGRLLVVWVSAFGGKHEIRGLRLDAKGKAVGGELTLHSTAAPVSSPAVAWAGSGGHFVVTWREGERTFGRLFK
jgi:hypothetical protein